MIFPLIFTSAIFNPGPVIRDIFEPTEFKGGKIKVEDGLKFKFPEGSKAEYRSVVTFKGHIPILGGQDGEAKVVLGTEVTGLTSTTPLLNGEMSVSSHLTFFSVEFNNAALPLDLHDAEKYFPLTKFMISPFGVILSSDAKLINIPVRLPGIDQSRLPNLSFLPIRLPVQAGGKATAFSDDNAYIVKIDGGFSATNITWLAPKIGENHRVIPFKINTTETFTILEDDSETAVKKIDATHSVTTVTTGAGSGEFDLDSGHVSQLDESDSSEIKSTDLDSKKVVIRHLQRAVKIREVKNLH